MKPKSQKFAVFIINMRKDVDKKIHMQTLCAKFNLDVEFIEAIDGKLLHDKEIEAVYSKKQAIKDSGRELTKGEIGCALSHKLIYQKLIDNNIQTALILEDDINFDQRLIDCLNSIDQFPDNWELMLLGHHSMISREFITPYNFWYKKHLNKTSVIRRPVVPSFGAYGYCINNKAAKKLLGHCKKIVRPIDYCTGNSKYVNLYIIQKPIIDINQKLTENSNLYHDRSRMVESFKKANVRDVIKRLPIYKIRTILHHIHRIQIVMSGIKPLRKYQ